MGLHGPVSLGPGHQIESFDCGKPALNEWLLRHARQAQASGSAKTFVATDDERVAGYFSLTVGQVDMLDAPERIRIEWGSTRFGGDPGAAGGVSPIKDAVSARNCCATRFGAHW